VASVSPYSAQREKQDTDHFLFSRTVSWADHGRDILSFIISYIDSTPSDSSSSSLPTPKPASDIDTNLLKLDNLSEIESGAAVPSQRRYRDRLIVGIGHSLGGGGTAFAATACPSLFSSIIFVDPVLVAPQDPTPSTRKLAMQAILRKQKWSTKEEALEGFKKKAFFTAWDEKMLEDYVTFGLRETKDGVTLKTTARSEAVSDLLPLASVQMLIHLRR